VVARQACQPRERRPRRKDDRRPSVAADLVEETIAYFPYNDVKGERLADRGKPKHLSHSRIFANASKSAADGLDNPSA
jgi:hypothetical protein